jgi:hypothetical protein
MSTARRVVRSLSIVESEGRTIESYAIGALRTLLIEVRMDAKERLQIELLLRRLQSGVPIWREPGTHTLTSNVTVMQP